MKGLTQKTFCINFKSKKKISFAKLFLVERCNTKKLGHIPVSHWSLISFQSNIINGLQHKGLNTPKSKHIQEFFKDSIFVLYILYLDPLFSQTKELCHIYTQQLTFAHPHCGLWLCRCDLDQHALLPLQQKNQAAERHDFLQICHPDLSSRVGGAGKCFSQNHGRHCSANSEHHPNLPSSSAPQSPFSAWFTAKGVSFTPPCRYFWQRLLPLQGIPVNCCLFRELQWIPLWPLLFLPGFPYFLLQIPSLLLCCHKSPQGA